MFFGNPPIKSNELYPITSCRGSSIRNMPEKYHKLRGHIYCFVWAITASCKRQQASFGDAMLELRNNISSSLLQERNSRLFEWNPNGIYEIIYIQYTCGCGSKCKVWIKPRSHTRSRPPIQTFRKDLIQTFDPDLWNDIMYWWVDVWSSDGCMLLGFLLCSYSPCQAAKQQTVVKPRCQAVTLPSCTCRKVTLPSSQAVQQTSCNSCTSKLSNCQADTVASCKASLPSSQAAHLLPAHLVVLFLSCCIQAATYTNMWVHFWADPDPDPDRSTPDPDHNHNQLRPRPHPAPC